MSAAKKWNLMSVEDYLAEELASPVREVYEGLDAVLPLPEIGIELPLAEIYDGVEFTPEPEEEDQ